METMAALTLAVAQGVAVDVAVLVCPVSIFGLEASISHPWVHLNPVYTTPPRPLPTWFDNPTRVQAPRYPHFHLISIPL